MKIDASLASPWAPSFKATKTEQFDPEYMGKLFDVGYQMAKFGEPWMKVPPELDALEEDQ